MNLDEWRRGLRFEPPDGRAARARRRGGRCRPCALLAFLVFLLAAEPGRSQSTGLVTRTDGVRRLSLEDAERGSQARLQGVVTLYDAMNGLLMVEDETAAVRVNPGTNRFRLKAGDLVEVAGTVVAGRESVEIIEPRITVVGSGRLPDAPLVTPLWLQGGRKSGRWVSLRGTLRYVAPSDGRLLLDVFGHGQRIRVSVLSGSFEAAERLVDAEVEVHGVCLPDISVGERWLRVRLHVPSLEHVLVRQPAPPDPFSLPLHSLGSVANGHAGDSPEHRVHVRGVVTQSVPRWYLYLQDGDESLFVVTADPTPLRAGDLVDVVGFQAPGTHHWLVEDAQVRRQGRGPAVEPLRFDPRVHRPPLVDARLLTVEGTVVSASAGAGAWRLILRAGATLCLAVIPNEPLQRWQAQPYPLGCKLRVTGVCSLKPREAHPELEMEILARSSGDVVVLEAPPMTTGQVLGIVCVLLAALLGGLGWVVTQRREIERRREAENVARGALAKLQTVIDAVPAFISWISLDGRYQLVNRRCEEWYRCPREKILGRTVRELTGEEAFAEMEPYVRKAVAGEAVHYQQTVTGPDQGLHEFEKHYLPNRDPEGRLQGYVALVFDVTERHRAEAALRESEERLRLLAENIPQVFWVSTFQPFRIRYVSPAYEVVFGRTRESLYENPASFLESVHPEDRAVLKEAMGNFSRGLPLDQEYRLIRPDGSIRWLHDRGMPVQDTWGRLLSVCGIAEDVTERRQLETALRASEKLVAIGRMAAGLAHEINNPLAGIGAAFELVKSAVPPGHPDLHYAALVEREINRISQIVRHMFTLYKPEAEQPRDLTFDGVVADAMELMQVRARQKGVMLTMVRRDQPVAGRQPSGPLKQVLLNLLSNAVDASAAGSEVRMEIQAAAGWVTLVVVDHGCGIPPEVSERVFEPFFTTKSEPPGTGLGLGLPVSRSLVEAMGGRLEFESAPHRLTAFFVRLPQFARPGSESKCLKPAAWLAESPES
jgi:PAS domain S-box-containing protein